MTLNKFHLNKYKRDMWECNWLIDHNIYHDIYIVIRLDRVMIKTILVDVLFLGSIALLGPHEAREDRSSS